MAPFPFLSRLGRRLSLAAALALLAGLTACGFTLRGATPMPLDTLYLGVPENTRFSADLRRAIQAASPNTRLVSSPKEAQATFQQVSNTRDEREVSLDAAGRIEEYELSVRYVFRVVDARGELLLPDTTLTAVRDMPYDDQVLQAKEKEAESLYQDMERTLVSRIVRRLTAPDVSQAIQASLANPAGETDGVTPAGAPETADAPPALPRPSLGSRPSRDF